MVNRNEQATSIMLYLLYSNKPVTMNELAAFLQQLYAKKMGKEISFHSARRILKRDIIDGILVPLKFINIVKKGRNAYVTLTPLGIFSASQTWFNSSDKYRVLLYVEMIYPFLKGISDFFKSLIEVKNEVTVKFLEEVGIKFESSVKQSDFTKRILENKVVEFIEIDKDVPVIELIVDMVKSYINDMVYELYNWIAPYSNREYSELVKKKLLEKLVKLEQEGVLSKTVLLLFKCSILKEFVEDLERYNLLLYIFLKEDLSPRLEELSQKKKVLCEEYQKDLLKHLSNPTYSSEAFK